jgi:hypothetical protein
VRLVRTALTAEGDPPLQSSAISPPRTVPNDKPRPVALNAGRRITISSNTIWSFGSLTHLWFIQALSCFKEQILKGWS